MRFLTAGFSHGKSLMLIIDDFPANVPIEIEEINYDLKRRQSGYGRGGRQQIENDTAEIISGIIKGKTTGAPIGVLIKNKDASLDKLKPVFCPRPGHADLPGLIKFNQTDVRNILERASARETAVRTIAGSFAKLLLKQLGIETLSFVRAIGNIELTLNDLESWDFELIKRYTILSELFCPSPEKTEEMKKLIDIAKENKNTLGGIVEVWIRGVPPGIGSFTQWDRRLDGLIAQGIMSIPAIKAVEIGQGIKNSKLYGSEVHDPIYCNEDHTIYRKTNNAGGIEGGMSNGEYIIIKAFMKPIATLGNPLDSIDIRDKKPSKATVERFDTCAVPACSVVAEAMSAWVVANCITKKFGEDELGEIKYSLEQYKRRLTK